MYKVIHAFADLYDGGHVYHKGDIFPRDGVEVSLERQEELRTSKNKIGEPLIAEEKPAKKEAEEDIKPKKNKANK